METQRISHPQKVAELHLLTGLHALQSIAGQTGGLVEALLGPAHFYAADADAITDSPTGIDDPLGMIGGHSENAARKMILCQPQNWGII